MIAALNVDCLSKTTLPFDDVIRHVWHKIRKGAVGFFHHAVFIVTVIGGAQPQCAFVLISLAGFDQCVDCSQHFAIGIQ